MRRLRDADTGRVRASLRAVLPAAATLALLLATGVLLGTILESAEDASIVEGLVNLFVQSARYVALIGVAVWLATRLERREYATFGLQVDSAWARDFAVGAAASLLGVAVSLWWGELQGFRAVDLTAGLPTARGGALAVGAVLAAYLGYFLLGNVYEEVVYRRIALGNFAEGLVARGHSPRTAVATATVASLALFGAYHVPLRGNIVVAVDAALVGVAFALAYLLTGDLGLSVGVHFGRVPTVFASGQTVAGVEVPAYVELTQNTLAANLQVAFVELGTVCLVVLAWVYATRGDLGLAASTRRPDSDD